MKKLKIIALTVAVALIFTGCMLSANQERLQNQAVATVNGVKITRQQVEFETKNSETYTNAMYYYGFSEKDLTENKDVKAWYQNLLSSMLDQMVINELLFQKAAELGVELTDEEKQEQRKASDDSFKSVKEMIRSQVEMEMAPGASPDAGESPEDSVSPDVNESPEDSVSPDVSESPEVSVSPDVSESPEASPSPTATPDPAIEAEVEKRYQEMLAGAPFNPDTYYDYLCRQKLVTKVREHINDITEVTDEDVSKWYNESVTAQQAEMDADPTVFATNMNNNRICVYVPEDTIAVKHVLITYKDQDLAETATELYTAGKTEEAMELLKAQIDELMPAMREIQQRLKNGESIDELIIEFGEDPGMASGTASTMGYLIGESTTTYLPEFKDAALKLTAVGNVSDPVPTYYGLHVMQTIKVYKKGVVLFDELKDAIKTALMPTKQQQKYDELIEQWKNEAKITYDKGRLYNK